MSDQLQGIGEDLERLAFLYEHYINPVNLRNGPGDQEIQDLIRDKHILITGCGTIGAALLALVLPYNPAKVTLVDSSEISLQRIKRNYDGQEFGPRLAYKLLDICSRSSVDEMFRLGKFDIVLHTAACKHLTLLEDNVRRAVEVNLGGSINLVESAISNGVDRFVFVSTDKAVEPTSVLGMTKSLAECYVRGRQSDSDHTVFSIARFGNVFGSSGSLVPIIVEQIKNQKPLTVTDPQAERFFLTEGEASRLVLMACVLGKGAETFIFDMGKPISIGAVVAFLLQKHDPTRSLGDSMLVTGLGPGEKKKEQIVSKGAEMVLTPYEGILKVEEGRLYPDTAQIRLFFGKSTIWDSDELLSKLMDLTGVTIRHK